MHKAFARVAVARCVSRAAASSPMPASLLGNRLSYSAVYARRRAANHHQRQSPNGGRCDARGVAWRGGRARNVRDKLVRRKPHLIALDETRLR